MAAFDGNFYDFGSVSTDLLDPLLEQLDRCCDSWQAGDPRFMTSQRGTAHIVLRFPSNYPESHRDSRFTEWWPMWSAAVSPVLETIGARSGYPEWDVAKVMFARLDPRSGFDLHVDSNASSRIPHKVHIPVLTNPGVMFTVGGEHRHLPVGRAYEINNLREHSVENTGPTPRVHLIIEVFATDPHEGGGI